jgi:hypothetical protein
MLALGSHERKECPSGCASGCATRRVLQLVHVRPTVSFSVKKRMRRPGLPEGHSNAKVIEHMCSCLRRRLTSRIGGLSDGKRNDRRSTVRGRESKILQGSRGRKSWQQIRMAQVLWGSKRRAFPIGRGVKRPDANFAGEVSATTGKERSKRQKNPTPDNSNLFPVQHFSLSLTNPLYNTNTANMLIYKVRLSSV